MILAEVVGLLGGSLTITCTIPHIIKSWNTRRTNDISFWHQFMMLMGCACWIAYGLMMDSISVIVTNVIFFGFLSFMTSLTVWYRKT